MLPVSQSPQQQSASVAHVVGAPFGRQHAPASQYSPVSQPWQLAPGAPQYCRLSAGWHMSLSSQQPVQPGSQTQVWVFAPQACAGVEQARHALPPSPQAAGVSAVWQAPLASQQPSGHDAAVQTQTPASASQACPAVQPPSPGQGWPQLFSAPPQSPVQSGVQQVPWVLHSWPVVQEVSPGQGWPQLLSVSLQKPAQEGVQHWPV